MATYTPMYKNVRFDVARLENDGYYYLYANIGGAQVPIQAIKLGVVDELVENARLAAEKQTTEPAPAQ